MRPGGPRPPCRARGRRPQKTVRHAPPTICTGLRGGRPACASAFCRGNTGCWVCLGAVCLPSGRRGPLGLYLGSLCWRIGTASLTRAAGRKRARRRQHRGPGPRGPDRGAPETGCADFSGRPGTMPQGLTLKPSQCFQGQAGDPRGTARLLGRVYGV